MAARHDEKIPMGVSDHLRKSAPGATVKTLVLSDLVDSTRLIDQLGDVDAAALFRRHDRLARDLLDKHEGLEIDKSDGFLLLFERPIQAVLFAMAYHRALEKLSAEAGVKLVSRVGIHVGEIILVRNEPRDIERGAKPIEVEGLAKPIAARLMSLATGRQTLISRGVYDMAQRGGVGAEAIDPSLRWLSHGSYVVKGVEAPIDVYEVGLKGMAPFTVPRDTPKAHTVTSEFSLGRSVLGNQSRRGRRIAMAALILVMFFAAALLVRRTVFTPVTTVRPAVSILGFKNVSERPDVAWFSTAFSEMLRTELGAGGDLRIISGENVARMMLELALPETDSLADDTLDEVRANLGTDYVVLGSYLVVGSDDKRSIRLDFRLQDTATGEILVSSSQVGSEEDLFAIATLAGVYLLNELGLDSPSAEATLAAKAALSESNAATALYAQALVKMRHYDALAARDLLLKAVDTDPEFALAHAALGEAWLRLGYDREAVSSVERAFQLAEARELPRETLYSIKGRYHEAANDWPAAIDTYRLLWSFFPDNVEYGLRLAEVQHQSGRDNDALATLDELRNMPAPARQDLRIDLMESVLAYNLGNYAHALATVEESITRAREQKAKVFLARGLLERNKISVILGDYERARADLDESRELFADVGDRGQVASIMSSLAVLLKNQGDLTGAEQLYSKALAIQRQIEDRKHTSSTLNNLSNISRFRGDLAAAEQMLRESLKIVREIHDLWREPTRLHNLGWVLLEQGRLAAAEEAAQQARDAQKAYGSPVATAWDEYLMGRISFAKGDLSSALDYYETSLQTAESAGDGNLEGRLLTSLATLLMARGELPAAAERLDRAMAIHLARSEHGHLAEVRLVRAKLQLELGQPTRAEPMARDAWTEFSREGRGDDVLASASILALALLGQDQIEEAEKILAQIVDQVDDSQRPSVRIETALASARLTASGDDIARQRLEEALAEARRYGFLGLELEVRLELSTTSDELDDIAREAEKKGYRAIASKARNLFNTPRTGHENSSPQRREAVD